MFEYIVACALLTLIACGFFVAPFSRLFKNSERESAYWQEQWKTFKHKQQQRQLLFEKSEINTQENRQLKQELVQEYLLAQPGSEKLHRQTQGVSTSKLSPAIMSFLSLLLALLLALALLTDYLSGRSQQAFHWHDGSGWMLPKVEDYLAGNDAVFENSEQNNIDTLLFLRSLQLYLQRHSTDAQAWSVLANVLSAAEANELALTAYQRAYRVAYFRDYQGFAKDKYALAYVNARLAMNAGQLDEESFRILNSVLDENPRQESALMLLGMAAYHSKQYQLADNAWSRLLAGLQGKADVPQDVLDSLSRSIASAKSASLLSESSAGNTNGSSPAQADVSFELLLDLEEKLSSALTEGAVLFVVLRVPEAQGMPLAAVRKVLTSVKDFPLRMTIGSANVLAGQNLQTYSQFELSVRISQSGQAIAQEGDLESDKVILDRNTMPEALEINIYKLRE